VRAVGAQKTQTCALWVAGVEAWNSVATHRVRERGNGAVIGRGTAATADISPLGMVEDVEGFRAELE